MNGLLVLAQRELVRYARQPTRLAGSLAQPLLFWLFMGSGFGDSVRFGPAGVDYGQFFFPGIVLMLLLFAAIFSTITLIEDRTSGFLQGVLVAPVSRLGLVLGKLCGGTAIALVQALLFLLFAPLAGFALSPALLLGLLPFLLVVGLGFTGLGFAVAWKMDTTAGYHAVMSVVMLPMWLLSGALFPLENASAWLGWIMRCNPTTYALIVVRGVFYQPLGALWQDGAFVVALAVTLVWTGLMVALAVWIVRREA